MIRKLNNTFILDTENTTYCFKVLPTGQLEHLYYGAKDVMDDQDAADRGPITYIRSVKRNFRNILDDFIFTLFIKNVEDYYR